MDHYLRFVMMLAAGLFGLGLVLKVLLDGLFSDWDAVADLKAWARGLPENRGLAQRQTAEDLLLEIEKSRAPTLNTRLMDQKREQLQELNRIEHRLSLPQRPVVLEPLAPQPLSTEAEAGADWVAGKS